MLKRKTQNAIAWCQIILNNKMIVRVTSIWYLNFRKCVLAGGCWVPPFTMFLMLFIRNAWMNFTITSRWFCKTDKQNEHFNLICWILQLKYYCTANAFVTFSQIQIKFMNKVHINITHPFLPWVSTPQTVCLKVNSRHFVASSFITHSLHLYIQQL